MNKLRRWLTAGLAAGGAALAVAARGAEPMGEIVVALRYFQQTGQSHAHLYLYREDGKLLRQLTKDDAGQDRAPVFAPDGESIVFTRRDDSGGKDCWSIEPRGGGLRMLREAPDWYTPERPSPHFDQPPDKEQEWTSNGWIDRIHPLPEHIKTYPVRSCRTPDGTMELTLTPSEQAGNEAPNGWVITLQGPNKEKETVAAPVLGYSASLMSCVSGREEKDFLLEGQWRLAFFWTHLNSTDGDTAFALDMDSRHLVQLSTNGAAPYPLPGEAGFLTLAEERYVPFGDGKHTANCSYIDRWDADLKRVRYAREKAAAVCYGASLYRPGKTPAVVTVDAGGE